LEFIIVPLDIQQSDTIAENDLSKSLIKLWREEFCCDLLKVSQFLLAKIRDIFLFRNLFLSRRVQYSMIAFLDQ
jgi:hypothetical protein